MSNAKAEVLLRRSGIKYEPEPDWVRDGRKPDFFCSGRSEFWCEVKTREPLPDLQLLSNARRQLEQRASNITHCGKGIAYIDGTFAHRDAKIITNLLERALARLSAKNPPEKIVVLVPNDPDYKKFVRFAISTKQHAAVEFHCCRSLSGKYGNPDGLTPDPYDQITRIYFSPERREEEVAARNVMTLRGCFRAAMVVEPSDHPFKILLVAPVGPAKKLNNPEWIRAAVDEANEQFKNASNFRSAPSLLMLFHDGLDVPDDKIINSGLYGDLQFQFSPSAPNGGRLILAGNGAWNSNKNRSTSAVMYLRNSGRPLIVHNYWAHRRFPEGIFACREIIALENDTFQETDFSQHQCRTLLFSIATRARSFFFANALRR